MEIRIYAVLCTQCTFSIQVESFFHALTQIFKLGGGTCKKVD